MDYLLRMECELIGFVQGLDWVRQKMIMDMKISQIWFVHKLTYLLFGNWEGRSCKSWLYKQNTSILILGLLQIHCYNIHTKTNSGDYTLIKQKKYTKLSKI